MAMNRSSSREELTSSGEEANQRRRHRTSGSIDESANTDDKFDIAIVKSFFHKKLHSASSLIKKQKPHTCKVVVVTDQDELQLMVSDGTFLSEVRIISLQ